MLIRTLTSSFAVAVFSVFAVIAQARPPEVDIREAETAVQNFGRGTTDYTTANFALHDAAGQAAAARNVGALLRVARGYQQIRNNDSAAKTFELAFAQADQWGYFNPYSGGVGDDYLYSIEALGQVVSADVRFDANSTQEACRKDAKMKLDDRRSDLNLQIPKVFGGSWYSSAGTELRVTQYGAGLQGGGAKANYELTIGGVNGNVIYATGSVVEKGGRGRKGKATFQIQLDASNSMTVDMAFYKDDGTLGGNAPTITVRRTND